MLLLAARFHYFRIFSGYYNCHKERRKHRVVQYLHYKPRLKHKHTICESLTFPLTLKHKYLPLPNLRILQIESRCTSDFIQVNEVCYESCKYPFALELFIIWIMQLYIRINRSIWSYRFQCACIKLRVGPYHCHLKSS